MAVIQRQDAALMNGAAIANWKDFAALYGASNFMPLPPMEMRVALITAHGRESYSDTLVRQLHTQGINKVRLQRQWTAQHIQRHPEIMARLFGNKTDGVNPATLPYEYYNLLEHYSAWKHHDESQQSPLPLIVLEDDAVLTPHFASSLRRAIAAAPARFFMIAFGGCFALHAPGTMHREWRDNALELYPINATRCASGYALSATATRLLTRSLEERAGDHVVFVDHVINQLVAKNLDATSSILWVEPPLSYESSKIPSITCNARAFDMHTARAAQSSCNL